MSTTGAGPWKPLKAGAALVDVLTNLHTTIGILAALRARGPVRTDLQAATTSARRARR